MAFSVCLSVFFESLCLSVCLSVCPPFVCLCLCFCVSACLYLFVSVCRPLSPCLSVSVFVSLCVCLPLLACLSVCVCLSPSVSVCLFLSFSRSRSLFPAWMFCFSFALRGQLYGRDNAADHNQSFCRPTGRGGGGGEQIINTQNDNTNFNKYIDLPVRANRRALRQTGSWWQWRWTCSPMRDVLLTNLSWYVSFVSRPSAPRPPPPPPP